MISIRAQPDVHTLVGAYVLDAVSDSEQRAFERHLSGCPACARETAQLRETVAWLDALAPQAPAPDIWPQVADTIGRTRQSSP